MRMAAAVDCRPVVIMPARRRLLGGLLLVLGLLGLLPPGTVARAQEARYELGRRVRVFEQSWAAHPDPAARRQASVALNEAVNQFFRMRLGEAGRAIARARFALEGEVEPSPARQWAESLAIAPERRLIDAGQTELTVTLSAFYASVGERPATARLRLSWKPSGTGPGGPAGGPDHEQAIVELPQKVSLPLSPATPGDQVLEAVIVVDGQAMARSVVGVSVVERLAERLDTLSAAIDAWPADAAPELATERATARGLRDQLRQLAEGKPLETDIPAAAWLAQCERLIAQVASGTPERGTEHPGDRWLNLALPGGRTVPVRLFVPESAARGEPLPIVVALHGAGGSENMFFDSYGAGAIVAECRQRGWLLVAPRSGPFGSLPPDEIVAALAKRYPVDRQRVFLVGHSMGAMQAVTAAARTPQRFAAVAALGGGGRVQGSEPLKALPFFVGVGTRDFARSGAQALNQALTRLGVATVTFREYPDIEHLAIVQVALPDVFAFFESAGPQP